MNSYIKESPELYQNQNYINSTKAKNKMKTISEEMFQSIDSKANKEFSLYTITDEKNHIMKRKAKSETFNASNSEIFIPNGEMKIMEPGIKPIYMKVDNNQKEQCLIF